MKDSRIVHGARRAFFAAAAVLLLAEAGCVASGYERGGDAAVALQKSADLAAAGRAQADAAVKLLEELVTDPSDDLAPQFEQFAEAVASLETMAGDLRGAGLKVKAKGESYLVQWSEDLQKIQNEAIRNQSASRKEQVRAAFAGVQKRVDQTNSELEPLLANLRDVRLAIGLDLTAAGLTAIQPIAAKAVEDAKTVGETLDRLTVEYRALGVSMSHVAVEPAKDAAKDVSVAAGAS